MNFQRQILFNCLIIVLQELGIRSPPWGVFHRGGLVHGIRNHTFSQMILPELKPHTLSPLYNEDRRLLIDPSKQTLWFQALAHLVTANFLPLISFTARRKLYSFYMFTVWQGHTFTEVAILSHISDKNDKFGFCVRVLGPQSVVSKTLTSLGQRTLGSR